ncbi:MAG: hypothetical protein OWU33_16290 [Firmicutes bacterium]|nr:hypothetical protein [Bacillota bacterium]
MIIDNFIRIGRPLREQTTDVVRQIRLVTDIEGTARDFYQRVFIVEVDGDRVIVHPYQQWGILEEEGKRRHFLPDDRAIAAPISISPTGNPTQPQGPYGYPAYPFYGHKDFASPAEARKFLAERLAKTDNGDMFDEVLEQIAVQLVDAVQQTDDSKGLVILCHMASDVYYYAPLRDFCPVGHVPVATSLLHGHREIRANVDLLLQRFWQAKFDEGASHGHRKEGLCSFCGRVGEVVSYYSRSWSWFTVTWDAPLSTELPETELVDTVGLCQDCYSAMTVGARVFDKLAQPLPPQVAKEAFSSGSEIRSVSRLPMIQGTLLVAPLLDQAATDFEWNGYVAAIDNMLERTVPTFGAQRHFDNVLGLSLLWPDEFVNDRYRITVTYFTKQNADTQLWAYIGDLVPSHLERLDRLIRETREEAANLHLRAVMLPSLLARMYGSGGLWQALSTVLRNKPLSRRHVVERMATAFTGFSKTLVLSPRDFWEYETLAKLYAVFHSFWFRYSQETDDGFGEGDVMKPWKTLLELMSQPIDAWELDNPEDLGFMTGLIVRQFSQRYYRKTHKDYLQSRVMTFGSSLTPDVIGYQALGRIQELALKLSIVLDRMYIQRVSACLAEFNRQHDRITRQKEAFVSAFWAGYGLYAATSEELTPLSEIVDTENDIENEEAQ